MSEIIPDTSKYDDLPNKLRALALILEMTDQPIQKRLTNASPWVDIIGRGLVDVKVMILDGGGDYRVPPKPRELWVCEFQGGHLGAGWDTKDEARKAGPDAERIVRFVEQPE